MKIIKPQSKHSQRMWIQSPRLRRFLYLMSPDGQLSSHPVMGMLWIVAVGCALGGIVLALLGHRGWSPLLICAAILTFNMVLGSLGQILFEGCLGRGADIGPDGFEPESPDNRDFPPDGTSPILPDSRPGATEVNLPGRERDQTEFHQRQALGSENSQAMNELVVISVSSRMLVAFAQRMPATRNIKSGVGSAPTGSHRLAAPGGAEQPRSAA